MALNTQKFDNWIRKHKLSAIAAPIVILLLIFFIITSFNKMMGSSSKGQIVNGYNNSLPNQSSELEVKDPNSYYKESIIDSLTRAKKGNSIKNIMGRDKEKDSLERILEDLDSFSLDENTVSSNKIEENLIKDNTKKNNSLIPKKQKPVVREKKLTEEERAQKRIEENRQYRKQLRESRLKNNPTSPVIEKLKIRAYVYRDQNVLPLYNVNLTVIDPFTYKGQYFEAGLSLFGTVEKVSNNKVFISVDAIGDMDIKLKAYDPRRKHEGLYMVEAGKLEQELRNEIENQGLQEVAQESGSGLANTMASIIKTNKRKKFTLIPLRNDDEMELKNY